jgi:hypothetical protein
MNNLGLSQRRSSCCCVVKVYNSKNHMVSAANLGDIAKKVMSFLTLEAIAVEQRKSR